MANTSSRTLRLLSLLQTHRFWQGNELAGRLEVSERTLRRDVDRLRELGYPVRSSRGVDGGYQLEAGGSMPPLVVDEQEAIALVVALGSSSAPGELGDATLSALSKVMQVLPAKLRRRAEAIRAVTVDSPFGTAPEVDASVLAGVAAATRDHERIRFSYTARGGQAAGDTIGRYAEPHHLVTVGTRWYLVAYDLDRLDWRSFRVDRMSEPAGTRSLFRPREVPGGDPADYVRSGLNGRDESLTLTALLHAPAQEMGPRWGRYGEISAVDDHTCRVRMEVRHPGWAIFGLGMSGVPFEIEQASPQIREAMGDWAQRFGPATG